MKKHNIIITILFSIFIFYSLINIKETNESTFYILINFSKTILPALLPFLILNQLLIKLGIVDILAYFFQFISYPLFKISGKGASIIIIGLLNGFPSSAIFTSLMLIDKQIEKEEAQRIINSIFFPSVSFLFAIISSKLKNNYLFTSLILSLYLSGFISLYISSFRTKKEQKYISYKQTIINIQNKLTNLVLIKTLKETIAYAFNTLINILGIIVIFSIPCNIIDNIITNNSTYFFEGLIEFSMPSLQILSSKISEKIATIMLCIILSFSGISSIMQATLFINDASLNTKKFIANRIIISILAIILLLLFFCFL